MGIRTGHLRMILFWVFIVATWGFMLYYLIRKTDLFGIAWWGMTICLLTALILALLG